MASELCEGVLERLTLYCNAMQVQLPPLQFDDDETDELVWTHELHEWIRAEGICLRWLFSGEVESREAAEARKVVERMPKADRARLLVALKDHQRNGGRLEDVMRRYGFG